MKDNPRYNEIIFTSEEENKIINMYDNGESTVTIGKQFGVSHKKIARILDSYGIPRIGNGRRKYSLDEKYFDRIDTSNKAYILGFLFADGSNTMSKCTISMSLQEEDKEILEAIRREIKSEKELEYIDYGNKHNGGYNYKNQYRLILFSSHICHTLNDIGMVPNKSLLLKFPSIEKDLYSHFIRGYFDGDGSFCPHLSKDGKFQPLITFTSTENFCNSLQKILIDELNIDGGNVYDASCHNGITKVLSISGAIQTEKILEWMYDDAELYLERKYQRYYKTFAA